MRATSARRRALLLALLLALACVGAASALPLDEAPGGAGPALVQPANGPGARASATVDRLRTALLARWRGVLAGLLGSGPPPACPELPARRPSNPDC